MNHKDYNIEQINNHINNLYHLLDTTNNSINSLISQISLFKEDVLSNNNQKKKKEYNNFEKKYNDWGLLSNVIHSDGNYYDLLKTNGGVSNNQISGFIEMSGKEIFKHAIDKLSLSLEEALLLSNKVINQIDWLVPHQANQRIILAVAEKLKMNSKKIISTVKHHGNTSAASIPLALDNAISEKKITNGNLLGFQAIGGGLSWGASIIRIGKPKN